jgi:hypothetical protein
MSSSFYVILTHERNPKILQIAVLANVEAAIFDLCGPRGLANQLGHPDLATTPDRGRTARYAILSTHAICF